jgi:uncharacterized RDD family membrane protein YckC
VAAFLIDGLIVAIPAVILSLLLFGGIGAAAYADSTAGYIAVVLGFLSFLLIIMVIGLLYAPLTMMRQGEHNGQTWGKQMLGIRVVRFDGQPMDFGWSLLREVIVKAFLLGLVSSLTFGVASLLDYLWPLWDDENRCLHDMIVNTRVIDA